MDSLPLQQRFHFAENGHRLRNSIVQREIGGLGIDHAKPPAAKPGQLPDQLTRGIDKNRVLIFQMDRLDCPTVGGNAYLGQLQ